MSISCTFPERGVVVTEAGSYSRLIYSCITQLKAQGPSRTCNESKEEGENLSRAVSLALFELAQEGVAVRGHIHALSWSKVKV